MKTTTMDRKSGYALVSVLGVMAVLTIAFSMLATQGQQSAFTSKRMQNRVKASAYAEAGIEFAYSIIAADYDNRLDPSLFRTDTSTTYASGSALESPYGEGTFALTVDPSSNGQYVVIHSKGTCGESSVDVEVLIEDMDFGGKTNNYTPPNYDDYDVFKMAMATEGSATFTGGGDLESGSTEITIHSNGKLEIKGNIDVPCSLTSSDEVDTGNPNTDIAGTVTAPSVTGKGNVSGGSTEATVDEITIPAVNMEDFRRSAVENGAYVEGDIYLFDGQDPPGGVWYVNGNVEVHPNATIHGTIIATGDIFVKGDVIQTCGIAVGTLGGDIKYSSQATSEGMIYTQSGTFTQTGGGSSGTITGQIIAGGGAFKTGGGDLVFGVYLPQPPNVDNPSSDSYTANPQIAAWQQ